MKSSSIILLFALVPALAFAQAPAQTPSSPPATQDQPATAMPSAAGANQPNPPDALARKYIEIWNTGDTAAINAFPPFIFHRHGSRFGVNSAKLAKEIGAWHKSMPDLKFNVDDVITQGDKAVLRLTLTGSYKERLFPDTAEPVSPPRPVRASQILIFKVRDGKISEIWEEYDELALRSEMGGRWRTAQQLAADAAVSSQPPAQPAPATSASPNP